MFPFIASDKQQQSSLPLATRRAEKSLKSKVLLMVVHQRGLPATNFIQTSVSGKRIYFMRVIRFCPDKVAIAIVSRQKFHHKLRLVSLTLGIY